MVTAEVADDAEPVVEVIGDRAADAVLIEAAVAPQAEVGVAQRGVDRLGAGGDGKDGQSQEQEDELFHTIRSFRGIESVPIGAECEEDGQGCRSRGSSFYSDAGWAGMAGETVLGRSMRAIGGEDRAKGRKIGGARRNRTADNGFADHCLTTWRPRHRGEKLSVFSHEQSKKSQ